MKDDIIVRTDSQLEDILLGKEQDEELIPPPILPKV